MTQAQRWALITGASSGIGFHCACTLAEAGFGVIITGRDAGRLQQALTQLRQHSDHVMALPCDQRQRDDIDHLLRELPDGITDVVANVGINPVHQHGPAKVHNTDFALLDDTLQTNLTHTVYLLAPLLNKMRQQKFGRIVLIGSQAGLLGIPGQLAYNLSKAALSALARTCANEYGRHNIFCQLLQPGIVLNERTAKLRQHLGSDNAAGVSEMQVAQAVAELLLINDPAKNGQEWNLPAVSTPKPMALTTGNATGVRA